MGDDGFCFKRFNPGDEEKVSQLVWEVFSEYVGVGYSQEGIDTFRLFIQPEELRKSLASGRFSIICSWRQEELAGVIVIRDLNHISLLFVKKEYHGKGIARELFKLAMEECKRACPDNKEFSVNSSPYAVKIYERLGFQALGPEQVQNGITYIPMGMKIL